ELLVVVKALLKGNVIEGCGEGGGKKVFGVLYIEFPVIEQLVGSFDQIVVDYYGNLA
ncbi:10172_t:CDS:1, partial [Funneliformis caledonium]